MLDDPCPKHASLLMFLIFRAIKRDRKDRRRRWRRCYVLSFQAWLDTKLCIVLLDRAIHTGNSHVLHRCCIKAWQARRKERRLVGSQALPGVDMPTAASPPPLRTLLLLFLGAIGIQCMTAAAHGITDDDLEDEFLTPDPPARPFATFSWLGLPPRVSRISMYEICMLQILLCFLLRFRWGRRENERIKALFLEQCASLLSEQFAYVGPGSEVGREGSQPAEGSPGKEEDLVAFKVR